MKRAIVGTLIFGFNSLFGDIIGGEINLGVYGHSPVGSIQKGGDDLDVESDLNWDDEKELFLKVYFEHPAPIIPNIMVGYSRLTHDGVGEISEDIKWAGVSLLNISDNIESSLELDIYDAVVYYEILDNWLNLDVGLDLKYFNGNLDIALDSNRDSTEINFLLPTLYGKGRFDIPTSDISLQVEGSFTKYDGNTYYDFEIGTRYTLMLGFGAEIGYRAIKMDIDDIDDDLSMDIDFDGFYGKVVWDF